MFNQIVNKQRRAVSAIKTALLGAGLQGRSVSAGYDSWSHPSGRVENYAIFISGPAGSDVEPYYETGKTITEVVKKVIDSIKGRVSDAASEVSETAPF